jgi:hypothetical protein
VGSGFSGTISLNNGTVETRVSYVFTNQNITFNGGTFSGLSSVQNLGVLTLAANSTINLDPPPGTNNPPGRGVLIFSEAVRTAGLLTINGWVGNNGQSGLDDKIRILTGPRCRFSEFYPIHGFSGRGHPSGRW